MRTYAIILYATLVVTNVIWFFSYMHLRDKQPSNKYEPGMKRLNPGVAAAEIVHGNAPPLKLTGDTSAIISETQTSWQSGAGELEWADSTPYKKLAKYIEKGNKLKGMNAFFEGGYVHFYSDDWRVKLDKITIDDFLKSRQ